MDKIPTFTEGDIVDGLRRISAVEAEGDNSVFAIDHASCSGVESALFDCLIREGLITCIGGIDFVTGYTVTAKGKERMLQDEGDAKSRPTSHSCQSESRNLPRNQQR